MNIWEQPKNDPIKDFQKLVENSLLAQRVFHIPESVWKEYLKEVEQKEKAEIYRKKGIRGYTELVW